MNSQQIAFEDLSDAAAVASAKAAEIYGLNIVAEDIQVYRVFDFLYCFLLVYNFTLVDDLIVKFNFRMILIM